MSEFQLINQIVMREGLSGKAAEDRIRELEKKSKSELSAILSNNLNQKDFKENFDLKNNSVFQNKLRENQYNPLKTSIHIETLNEKNQINKAFEHKLSTFDDSDPKNWSKLSKDITKLLHSKRETLEYRLTNEIEHSGRIASMWDSFKNKTGLFSGSEKVAQSMEEFDNQLAILENNPQRIGEIYKNLTGEEISKKSLMKLSGHKEASLIAEKELVNYTESQKDSVEITTDAASAIAGVAAATAIAATGGTATPVVLMLAGGAAAGAGTSIVTNYGENLSADKPYTPSQMGKNAIRGTAMASVGVISAGVGSAVSTALSVGPKVTPIIAATAEGAVDGALSGSFEGIYDAVEENKSAKDVLKQGAIGLGIGAVSGATMGAAVSGTTKAFGKFTKTKANDSHTAQKIASELTPNKSSKINLESVKNITKDLSETHKVKFQQSLQKFEEIQAHDFEKIKILKSDFSKDLYIFEATNPNSVSKREIYDSEFNLVERESIEFSKTDTGAKYEVKSVENLQTGDAIQYTTVIDNSDKRIMAQELRVSKNPDGSLKMAEIRQPSDVKGVYNITQHDGSGNTKILSSGNITPEGNVVVKKDLTSSDGTNTVYDFVQTPDGNRNSNYTIKDKDGKILLQRQESFTKLDENTAISAKNGKEYKITYSDSKISVKNLETGKETSLNLDEIVVSNPEKIVPALKQFSAEDLIAIKRSGVVFEGTDLPVTHYDSSTNKIISDGSDFSLHQESGSAFNQIIKSEMKISDDKQLHGIFQKELEEFKKTASQEDLEAVKNFILKFNDTVAESNALINNSSMMPAEIANRVQYLQENFPKTIAKIESKYWNHNKAMDLTPQKYSTIGKSGEAKTAYKISESENEVVRNLGEILAEEFRENLGDSLNQIKRLFGEQNGVIVFGRSKGADSSADKLVSRHLSGGKSIQNYFEARKIVTDSIGTRILMPDNKKPADILNKINLTNEEKVYYEKVLAENPDEFFLAPFDSSKMREMEIRNDIQNALIEAQSQPILDTVILGNLKQRLDNGEITLEKLADTVDKKYIDALKNPNKKIEPVKITNIDNYRGPDGLPYFTERQLDKLKEVTPNLTVVSSPSEFELQKYNFTQQQKAAFKDSKKRSGYTTSQINIVHNNGALGELQMRGTLINDFAEYEHIAYDARQAKSTLGPVFDEFKSKLISLDDEQMALYNNYLNQTYKFLRLKELGVNVSKKPTLPEGFDPILSQESLKSLYLKDKESKLLTK